jgi:hypothetical protein
MRRGFRWSLTQITLNSSDQPDDPSFCRWPQAIGLFTDARDGFNVDAADVVVRHSVPDETQNHGLAGILRVVRC